jgi:phosphodiesterase/alkaline phosphatase D-like protein
VEGGYSPEDLRKAYELPSGTAGSGQTVAVVDAYDDPNAEEDLAVYRSHYKLPECTAASGCFRKVNQGGHSSPPPAARYEWAEEISLDLDMVSAACPKCHILLVEANSEAAEDLAAAENEAVALGATELSNSFGSPEGSERPEVAAYDHPGIPTTVAGGDNGFRVEEPADNPHVISVGGTTLTPTNNTRGWTEKVWYDEEVVRGKLEISGTGSGCSREPKPSWQIDNGCAGRTTNDIAVVGDQNTPVSIYDSWETKGAAWLLVGGTSVGAPVVAATMAMSNSYTRSFDGAQALYADYAVSGTGVFHDVVSGKNGSCGNYLCEAEVGYDGPTGLGTLNGAPEAPTPVLVTKAASPVGSTEATLNATIDPNGVEIKQCRFEYGPTPAPYGSSVPCSKSPGSGTSAVVVSAAVAGLHATTLYHFRIAASYQNESAGGIDRTFTTTASAPTVATEAASGVGPTSATLNAKVNPNGKAISSCVFEYGTSTSYSSSAPCSPSPGSGQSPVSVTTSLEGLLTSTTYHFRVSATNADGTSRGGDQTFKTPAAVPAIAIDAPTELSQTSAMLNAAVNPEGRQVKSCKFEYGPSPEYGASVPCTPAPGAGHGFVPVSAEISGLEANVGYAYRVVATNAEGTATSAGGFFTTLPTAATATTEAFFAVTQTSVTLTGIVDPHGGELTTCRFEYGTSPAGILEASTPCATVPGGGEEGAAVSSHVTGLAPGVTYYYRLVAANVSGSSYGNTMSFRTEAASLLQPIGPPLPPLTGRKPSPRPGTPKLASRILAVSGSGHLEVPVACPAGASACSGRLTFKTLTAVGSSSGKRQTSKRVLVLAAGSFTVSGGSVATVALRLSSAARALLKRSHVLHARGTLSSGAGGAQTARSIVTIRAASH